MIKIVAEAVKKRNKTLFVVKVLDGTNVLQEETAPTINKRDELIWSFAEQFNTTDIEIVNERDQANKEKRDKQSKKFRYSEIPSIPVLDMADAADFFDDHEDVVYNRVIIAVREGIESGKNVIRLFELNGSGVYLTSEKEDWKPGLENAMSYFEEIEEYEKCAVCRDLLKKL
jgi:hypothetical protein